MEKTSTFLDKMIHIMFGCVMHLHGHWNKVVPLMKPSIFGDISNGTKFCNYTCWSINDTQDHRLPHWVSNHHIGNENLVFSGHVKIDS
jgi:hypothetical protein